MTSGGKTAGEDEVVGNGEPLVIESAAMWGVKVAAGIHLPASLYLVIALGFLVFAIYSLWVGLRAEGFFPSWHIPAFSLAMTIASVVMARHERGRR